MLCIQLYLLELFCIHWYFFENVMLLISTDCIIGKKNSLVLCLRLLPKQNSFCQGRMKRQEPSLNKICMNLPCQKTLENSSLIGFIPKFPYRHHRSRSTNSSREQENFSCSTSIPHCCTAQNRKRTHDSFRVSRSLDDLVNLSMKYLIQANKDGFNDSFRIGTTTIIKNMVPL